jgi:hypothetical protein
MKVVHTFVTWFIFEGGAHEGPRWLIEIETDDLPIIGVTQLNQ